ncbi:DUF6794 domain-containing protein [uncultured Dokdonia sp.]|uniref:DUF6794 domain-containing protein n=1 Tax=uncultured Dokdonia sp. TaxID=575653 RepID=UPI002612B045|nr:DUF6794 domain-containing protein [uncultured Dokdonia sp.]
MNKLIFVVFLILPTFLLSQNNCEKYIKKYIPIDLNDAISYFECKSTKDEITAFKNKTEKDATSSLHFEAGMSIRNNWKLWAGTSEISKYFRNLGIHHPDDMSGIIFTSLHRKLNHADIDLENQIKFYQEYWAESKRKEKERKKDEFNKFKIGDKVEFSYKYDYVSKRQKKRWWDDKCIATAVIEELNADKFELKIRLLESCDRKGIIVLKYDVWEEINGEYEKTIEDKIEIMKKGETRWSSYYLWDIMEK